MQKYVIANFKMHKNANEVRKYIRNLNESLNDKTLKNIKAGLFLNHLHVLLANEMSQYVFIGAQSGHFENEGAFTSAVSLKQLNDDGINYVMLGHSEEFMFFHESFEKVNKKLLKTLELSMIPLVCFGESEVEVEFEKTINHLENQIQTILKDVDHKDIKKIIFAYEPRWAIGKTQALGQEMTEKIILAIKKYIQRNYNVEATILYGGSVKLDTIEGFIRQESIDGVLIGKEALDVNKYLNMLKITEEVLKEINASK